jgi:hypothetical protein
LWRKAHDEPPDEEVFDRFPNVYFNADNFEHYRGRLERRLLIKRCQDSTVTVLRAD